MLTMTLRLDTRGAAAASISRLFERGETGFKLAAEFEREIYEIDSRIVLVRMECTSIYGRS